MLDAMQTQMDETRDECNQVVLTKSLAKMYNVMRRSLREVSEEVFPKHPKDDVQRRNKIKRLALLKVRRQIMEKTWKTRNDEMMHRFFDIWHMSTSLSVVQSCIVGHGQHMKQKRVKAIKENNAALQW